ncbi:hypothetical protein Tco_0542308 [Tanacetum coccineum]
MVAPAVSVSTDSPEESFGDTIKIGMDVTHPVPEEVRALRDRLDVAEEERATLRATVRRMGAIETVLHNHMRDERQARIEIERQLASVHESHRQDREDFKKIKDFMTSQFGYRP